jgi:chromosome segregation ATPase
MVTQKQFRDQMIEQRDQEIEIVIQRLESETGSNNSDATRKYRMDIERIKSETAEEIKQLRDQHSLAIDKLLMVQNQVQQLEGQTRSSQKEVIQLQHQIVTKDNVLRKQKQELARLQTDESRLMEQIRVEFENELRSNENKIEKLNTLIQEHERTIDKERDLFQEKMDQHLKDKELMIQQVEAKVMHALQLKDSLISKLNEQLQESLMKSQHLEALIEKQREVLSHLL